MNPTEPHKLMKNQMKSPNIKLDILLNPIESH